MKIIANRKTLANDLKYIKSFSGNEGDTKGMVFLVAEDNCLSLIGGYSRFGVVAGICRIKEYDVEIIEEGETAYLDISYLSTLIGQSPDETITISLSEKGNRISISGDSYRARLSTMSTDTIPFRLIEKRLTEEECGWEAVLDGGAMKNLVQLSRALPSRDDGNQRYIHFTTAGEAREVSGSTQASSVVSVDWVTLAETSDGDIQNGISLNTDLVAGALSLCGDSVRIRGKYQNFAGVILDDPEDDLWWVTIAEIAFKQ